MKNPQFCNSFCGQCDKCKEALVECRRIDDLCRAIDEHDKNVKGNTRHVFNIRRIALDHRGSP